MATVVGAVVLVVLGAVLVIGAVVLATVVGAVVLVVLGAVLVIGAVVLATVVGAVVLVVLGAVLVIGAVVLATVVGAVVLVVLGAVLVIGAVVLATVVGAVVLVVLVTVLVVGAATEEMAPVALAGDELLADALAVQTVPPPSARMPTTVARRSLKHAGILGDFYPFRRRPKQVLCGEISSHSLSWSPSSCYATSTLD